MLKPQYSEESESSETYDPPSGEPDAPTLLETREDMQYVRRALDTLPPDWRMILVLREYPWWPDMAGLSEAAGVNAQMLKRSLHKAFVWPLS
jgi:DNA-directed RNA polymerase specialized sigma24 family protein